MRNFRKAIIIIICAAILSPYAAAYELTESEHIFSDGIIHKEIRADDYFNDGSGRNEIFNLLEVDFTKKGISALSTISHDCATGLQTIGEQAYAAIEKGKNVVAGINCDMYAMDTAFGPGVGTPSCPTIVDGVIYNSFLYQGEPSILPIFTVDENNNPDIKNLKLNIHIEMSYKSGKKFSYDTWLFNRNFTAMNSIIVFNSKISEGGILEILTGTNSGYDIDLSKATFYIISGAEGASEVQAGKTYKGTVESYHKFDGTAKYTIPDDGFIIVDLSSQMYYPPSAVAAEFTFSIDEIIDDNYTLVSRNDIVQAVGAYNWIVKDGVVQTIEIYKKQRYPIIDRLITANPARTGIGIKADGTVVAATVDSRVWDSDGMTMEEWGEFFASQGCINAVNFDGGGSTEMVAIGSSKNDIITVNKPSNNVSREIATGLFFTADDVKVKGLTQPLMQPRTVMVLAAAILISATVISGGTVFIVYNKRKGDRKRL